MRTQPCVRCPARETTHILNGERLCTACAISSLTATTVARGDHAGLAHELPRERPTISKPRPHGPQREARRSKAERRAIAKLKLIHLPEYLAIYAAELHAEGLKPTETVQFDIHLRKLAGNRLLALTSRSANAG